MGIPTNFIVYFLFYHVDKTWSYDHIWGGGVTDMFYDDTVVVLGPKWAGSSSYFTEGWEQVQLPKSCAVFWAQDDEQSLKTWWHQVQGTNIWTLNKQQYVLPISGSSATNTPLCCV
jgi:hypothetical protein